MPTSHLFKSMQKLVSIMGGRRRNTACAKRVVIMEHVFGTFNGFWEYYYTELNFSMQDTPSA